MDDKSPSPSNKPALALSLSWRTLALLLLVVIAVITFLWKPWIKTTATRTITVQGQATISATPDKYDFQPIFQNADIKTAIAAGNEAVAQLKKLGVKDADLKTTTTAAGVKPQPATDMMIYPPNPIRDTATYTITATVRDKDLAQKVSDYLATTSATGLVTPTAGFTKPTADRLDLDARSQASDNAKSKADVMAKQLGAKVGKVVKISDSNYGVYAVDSKGSTGSAEPAQPTGGPTIQPGTNEVNYTFTVEFELK